MLLSVCIHSLVGSINSILTVSQTVVADRRNGESNVTVICDFSSRFQGSSCEIALGTTTMDLVSTATGHDGVPVQLAVELNCSYFYTATFNYEESGVNIVVQIEGQFTTCGK